MNSLARDYFNWLYEQAFGFRDVDPDNNYTIVCDAMHQFAFKDLVPHDDNRISDGTSLRDEFLKQYKKRVHEIDKLEMIRPDATMLEVLISLARRADFMMDRGVEFWFNRFIENLKVAEFTDKRYSAMDAAKIERRLRRFNDRRYSPDGHGGIFPLNTTMEDQRKVELWYQMAAYMTDQGMY